jgi:YegS/Rv2252/BmrU family lipid kinase
MQKAVLLYNPLSGRRRDRRVHDVEKAAGVLRRAGKEISFVPTRGAADAMEQVREFIAHGYDTIFACGGDGTVHDLLQGIVGTDAALGVIPLGTANALAHDLGIPLTPEKAAQAALTAQHKRIAVGRVEFADFHGNPAARYFTVAVGIGVDAHLFYKLNSGVKNRLGMAAYYAKAWNLWMTHKMERFRMQSDGQEHSLTELLAVRIRYFGGVMRELAPGASLASDDLRLLMSHTDSRLSYLRYVVRGMVGAQWSVPGIELRNSQQVACTYEAPASSRKVYVEADGELLGTLPVKIYSVPDAVTLLMP